MTDDVVIVTRHDPVTCTKVLVVIATQFAEEGKGVASVTLTGKLGDSSLGNVMIVII